MTSELQFGQRRGAHHAQGQPDQEHLQRLVQERAQMGSDSMCQMHWRLDQHQLAGLPRAPSKKPMNALTLALGKRLDVCRAHSSDG